MSQARLGHLYLVHSAKTRQETFFFKASHEPLMGNCKMLCQTSTNGRCLSLAPLKCCHWVGGIKKLKRGRGSKSTKDKQWIQCSGPGCRGALCWLCPLSACAGGQAFVLQKSCATEFPVSAILCWGQIPRGAASPWAPPLWLTSTFCSHVRGQIWASIWPILMAHLSTTVLKSNRWW